MRALLPPVLVALALWMVAEAARAQDSLEYPVKAAFLARFGGFVEWPPGAFASPAAPLQLCVLGDDPFGPALDRAAAAQQADGRTIQVRRLKTARADSGCHILYLAPSEAPRAAQVLEALRGAPVLTASDARPGAPATVIGFVVREERVRFEIDDEAAQQHGLAISSKLLALAVAVKPRKGAR